MAVAGFALAPLYLGAGRRGDRSAGEGRGAPTALLGPLPSPGPPRPDGTQDTAVGGRSCPTSGNYRIRALLYAGTPDWEPLGAVFLKSARGRSGPRVRGAYRPCTTC